jgi:NADH-quinone oxidoreductase subunit M
MHSYWWINALLAVPLAAVLVVLAVRKVPGAAYAVGVVAAAIETGLALFVAFSYPSSSLPAAGEPVTFAHRVVVAPAFGLAYDVGVDGISVFLVLLTAIVVLLALLGARDRRAESGFVAWLMVLTTATIGAFVSRDLLEFFLFFELTLIPSYFIIARWGGSDRARAALKFFIYTLLGSGFLLVGAIYLAIVHQENAGGPLSFAYDALAHSGASHGALVWVFVAFAIAFGVKSPIWPLHTWSPLAYAEAPPAGSMVLSALLAKLGTYGLLRFAVLMLPAALSSVQPYLLTLAVIGIVYGSAVAAVSTDLKRLVAYSSLAQIGFIVLGSVSANQIATSGAVLLMFNHGVITAGFFLLIGFLERRRGTATIASLTGLQRPAPILAASFTVVMFASIGLPGLSGFVGEFLILIGTFAAHQWFAVVAALGTVLAALYLLWAYQRVFHGRAEGEDADTADLTHRERWVMVPIIALVVVLGVFPRPLLSRIDPTVHHDVTTSQVATTPPGGSP